MGLWTYSARSFLRRPGRNGLTLLGIILALASVVATQQTLMTLRQAYATLFAGLNSEQDLEIAAAGQAGFATSVASIVQSLPEVDRIQQRVIGLVALSASTDTLSVPIHGLDFAEAGALGQFRLVQGHPPSDGSEALLDRSTARALHREIGDTVQAWGPNGLIPLRLTGLVEARDATSLLGGLLLVSLPRGQTILRLEGWINSIQVIPRPGTDLTHLQQQIQESLPTGLSVLRGGQRGGTARNTLQSIEQGLAALSCVALVAATFVMINTLMLNLGERRRELAILRTLGMTPRELTLLLLGEMLIVGLIGSAAGSLLGLLLSWGLLAIMGPFLGIVLSTYHWHPKPFVLAAILGPGIALLVALVPVRQASGFNLLAELLQGRYPVSGQPNRRMSWLGGLLLIPGIILSLGLTLSWFTQQQARFLLVPGIGLLLIGLVLILPQLVEPSLKLIGWLMTRLEPRLALQQLIRHPGRTQLTAAVLFLSLAACIGFGHTIRGLLSDLPDWYQKTILADFLIRGSVPDASFAMQTALPESLANAIETAIPDARVEKISFLPCIVNNQDAMLLPRSFDPTQRLPLDLLEGEAGEVCQRLLAGEVVLGVGLARQLGVQRGQTVTIETPKGPRSFTVAGIAQEYAGGGAALYIEFNHARDEIAVPGVHVFLVSSRSCQPTALGAALEQYCRANRLLCQANADLRTQIVQDVNRITGILWAMLVLIFLVAVLGIFNTLTMNVNDQAGELGLLRALGLQARQVRRLVLWQGAILALVILIPGVITGISLGYLIERSNQIWGGLVTPFRLDLTLIVVSCLVAFTMTLLAALGPARRAQHLPVLQLLS